MSQYARLGAGVVLIAIAGSSLWAFFPQRQGAEDGDFVVGVTAFSIAMVTFFGILGLDRRPDRGMRAPEGERLRTAIACSLVVTYLYLVTFTTFVGNAIEIGAVTQTFVESFSTVIGITIAFYFGASAATQIFGKEKEEASEGKGAEEKSAGS